MLKIDEYLSASFMKQLKCQTAEKCHLTAGVALETACAFSKGFEYKVNKFRYLMNVSENESLYSERCTLACQKDCPHASLRGNTDILI